MFLTPAEAAEVRERFGTPCYVYDRRTLEAAARAALGFPAPFGFTLRYAMKANPSRAILGVFLGLGLDVDASSDHEVERALRAGVPPDRIQLTSQMPSRRLAEFVARGIRFNACSLHQLDRFGHAFPGRDVSIRVNPGLGSGATNRTNTGGPGSSFGIWHERLEEATALAARHGVVVRGLHTHIGSGSDPAVWKHVARMSLGIAARLPDVTTINLGGGFKVARVPEERSADLADIGAHVRQELVEFHDRTGRELRLEIEPGTYLVADAGCVVSTCIDVADTGAEGYRFAKLDTGMTEITRPSLYGATASHHGARRTRARARGIRRPVLRIGRHPHPGAGRPGRARAASGAAARDRRPGRGRRRWRLLRRDVDDQLQLLPAGARGHAGAGRYAAAPPTAPGTRGGLGERGVSR